MFIFVLETMFRKRFNNFHEDWNIETLWEHWKLFWRLKSLQRHFKILFHSFSEFSAISDEMFWIFVILSKFGQRLEDLKRLKNFVPRRNSPRSWRVLLYNPPLHPPDFIELWRFQEIPRLISMFKARNKMARKKKEKNRTTNFKDPLQRENFNLQTARWIQSWKKIFPTSSETFERCFYFPTRKLHDVETSLKKKQTRDFQA